MLVALAATGAVPSAAPWWAVPGGVIVGAVLTGLFAIWNEGRRTSAAEDSARKTEIRGAAVRLGAAGLEKINTELGTPERVKTHAAFNVAYTAGELVFHAGSSRAATAYFKAVNALATSTDPDAEQELRKNVFETELSLRNAVRQELGYTALTRD